MAMVQLPLGRREPVDLTFLAEVIAATARDSRVEMCIQCGTCGGSCPSASEMDHTPRQLFAMTRAGMRDTVLGSNTAWACVSCYYCAVRCPQEVHIPDVMYAIKSIAGREGRSPNSAAPAFARTFVANIRRYGRSFEIGLVAKHYMRHFPTRIPGMATAGMGMLASGRMELRPHRIKDVMGLQAILDRAQELEKQS